MSTGEGAARPISRRALLGSLAALGAAATGAAGMGAASVRAAPRGPKLTRAHPTTGEFLPVIGMGSWITFNVGADQAMRDQRVEVLRAFFGHGGAIVDSSPMYGTSEDVIGYCLERLPDTGALFSATKVWTWLQAMGAGQMDDSRALWNVETFDLMQVHNLLNWEGHLETLRADKAAGRIRHIGITTSHGRRHDEFEAVMRGEKLDFVQFTYNILDREAERRLLPLAAELGLGVLINRPFRQGALFPPLQRHSLPEWAVEIDCLNWAQFLLKFIVSHPAVTAVIPATSRVEHMAENMGALYGRLPDAGMRARMVRYVEEL